MSLLPSNIPILMPWPCHSAWPHLTSLSLPPPPYTNSPYTALAHAAGLNTAALQGITNQLAGNLSLLNAGLSQLNSRKLNHQNSKLDRQDGKMDKLQAGSSRLGERGGIYFPPGGGGITTLGGGRFGNDCGTLLGDMFFSPEVIMTRRR